jgi:hypothetical protein
MVALTFGRDLALSRLSMFFRLGRLVRTAARSVQRPLGQAEAGRRDHLFDLAEDSLESTLSRRSGSRPRTGQLGGKHAFMDRAGKDRSPTQIRHSIAARNRPYRPKRLMPVVTSSASASAISGISRVGAKPSSAGARAAWASAGRTLGLIELRELQSRSQA